MKALIVSALYGLICGIVLPKVGIPFDSTEYWIALISGGITIGMLV